MNDVNFENMTNDEAVRVLREVVQKPGPIKLVVAKCWDPNPKGYFTIPRTEPVRPIDPGAWVAHTQALRSHEPVLAPDATLTGPQVSQKTNAERHFRFHCKKQNVGVTVKFVGTTTRSSVNKESPSGHCACNGTSG